MIEIKDVNFSYEKDKEVLKNLNLTVKKGEKVGLVGANGAGKSTLFKTILGLSDFEGKIIVDDLVLNKKTINEIRRKVGYVLQNPDNQMFMPSVLEDMIFGPMNYGVSKDEAISNAENILKQLDLEYLKEKKNYKMSGGEKRMAAIATILNMNPDYLLLDEPSNDLDPNNKRKLISILNDLKQTIIIASHDLDLLLEIVDRVVIMNNGTIVADGNVKDILWNEKLLIENCLQLPYSIKGLPNRFRKHA